MLPVIFEYDTSPEIFNFKIHCFDSIIFIRAGIFPDFFKPG